jgi:hypothetical protein
MTCVAAIFALVPGGIEKEFVAVRAENDLVELLRHKFVAIHLMNLLALPNSNLPCKAGFHRTLPHILLDWS